MLNRKAAQPGQGASADPCRCALLAAGIDAAPLLNALRRVPNTRVGDICIFPANGRGEPEADFLILAAEDGNRLSRLEPQIDRWSGQKTHILLAVPESKCAFLGDLANRADGLILMDAGLSYLEQSLSLAREGYSVMPSSKTAETNAYGHLDMLGRLSDSEQAILPLLAMGASNRCISEELGESETRVKSLVRTILVKLDCRNRTEAAVLAATVLLPLQESLRKQQAKAEAGMPHEAEAVTSSNGHAPNGHADNGQAHNGNGRWS